MLRRVGLLGLLVVGCGGRRLVEFSRRPQQALPPVVGSQRVSWSCKREPVAMQVRSGIPASVALFSNDSVYVALDVPVRSARNPLQRYYFPRAGGVPRHGCRPRTATGTVDGVDPYYGIVGVSPHQRYSTAADTRLETPEVDGVPRLTHGLRVKVRALRCPGRKLLVARSITAAG